MPLWQDQSLEGPDGPKRYNHGEVLVFTSQPVCDLPLESQVVTKKAGAVVGAVLLLSRLFFRRLIGHVAAGPYLAVGMRIAGTHNSAAILEDLHIVNKRQSAQFIVLSYPDIDDLLKIRQRHIRNREIVAWREADYAANAIFATRN